MKIVKQPYITNYELRKLEKHLKKIKNGEYEPYITVRRSNSVGLSHIVFSHKTKRCHHLFSLGELALFLHLEHDPEVLDIQEQYPLPINETLKWAKYLNYRHPAKYKERDGKDIPAATMTTDFVVTLYDATRDQLGIQPYNYKPSSALSTEFEPPKKVTRTQQKFKIEEMYWGRYNHHLTQITDEDLNPNKTYNLQWLRETYHHVRESQIEGPLCEGMLNTLNKSLMKDPEKTLKQHLNHASLVHDVTELAALEIFQHLAYSGQLDVDLNERIEVFRPVMMISQHDEN
ncbi:TnsA endonuclease N-terminal domain-containing protein [Vibrio parahaemolyticus]